MEVTLASMTKYDKKYSDSPRHGCPLDRGMADSYYYRNPRPHYWPEGTEIGVKVEAHQMTPDEIEEYLVGYYWNEKFGEKKDDGEVYPMY